MMFLLELFYLNHFMYYIDFTIIVLYIIVLYMFLHLWRLNKINKKIINHSDLHVSVLSYSWYKDKFSNFIFSNRKPHIFISRDGKLYFSTATKDDQGNYTCVVAVPGITGGKHSMPIPLHVKESCEFK